MKLKVLYQKWYLLPFLIGFTYLCLLLDTIKYPGFIGKHFFIDAKIFFAFSVILLFLQTPKSRLLNFLSKINFLVMVMLLLAYATFSVLEGINYPNYVLSKFHFSMEGLIYVLLFSISIFAISKFEKQVSGKAKDIKIVQIILYFFLAYAFIVNVGASLKDSIDYDTYFSLHLRDSYGQKMHYQWGNYYDYMVFVKDNTPENATIVIPPQIAPWWTGTGNAALNRYFLYPRKLVQYQKEDIPEVKFLPKGTYIMIAWGGWECDQYGCKGWPTKSIKASKAIFKDSKSSNVKEIKQDFLYDPKDTSNPFGLLKI